MVIRNLVGIGPKSFPISIPILTDPESFPNHFRKNSDNFGNDRNKMENGSETVGIFSDRFHPYRSWSLDRPVRATPCRRAAALGAFLPTACSDAGFHTSLPFQIVLQTIDMHVSHTELKQAIYASRSANKLKLSRLPQITNLRASFNNSLRF